LNDEIPQVWEGSDPDVAAIYGRIPALVGVPGVHKLWRWLATSPQLLPSLWPAIDESLRAIELEDYAHRLRAVAFIVEAAGMPSHKAFRGDLVRAEIDANMRAKIERFNDASQLGLSRLLVVAQAMARPWTGTPVEPGEAGYASPIPALRGAVYVAPLRSQEITGKAREVLMRVQDTHSLPFLDDYFYSIARIPEYLGAAWNAISPVVGDAMYLDRAAELTRIADEAASVLPVRKAFSSALQGLHSDRPDSIRSTLRQFAEQVLPQTLIDVTLIKALTSGPEHAVSIAE
jgi:hypothetical protein